MQRLSFSVMACSRRVRRNTTLYHDPHPFLLNPIAYRHHLVIIQSRFSRLIVKYINRCYR